MLDFDKLKVQMSTEEGRKNKAYTDTRGKVTVGIGRNLTDKGLSDEEVDYLYKNDILSVTKDLTAYLPWVFQLDDVRLRVFYDLCFNMGVHTLLSFTHMLAYAQADQWDKAADALHNSQWDGEVGKRAPKLENMLRTGEDL